MKAHVIAIAMLVFCSGLAHSAETEDTLVIAASDVWQAKVVFKDGTSNVLELDLLPEKGREFTAMTKANVGRHINVQILGRMVDHPRVNEAILAPRFQVALADEKQALDLARELTKEKK